MDCLPLEIVGEIAKKSRAAYLGLVRSYPKFARSLCLGDRLDYAELFGYDVHILHDRHGTELRWTLNGKLHRTDGYAVDCRSMISYASHGLAHRIDGPATVMGTQNYMDWVRANPQADPTHPPESISAAYRAIAYQMWYIYGILLCEHWHALFTMTG